MGRGDLHHSILELLVVAPPHLYTQPPLLSTGPDLKWGPGRGYERI